MPANHPEVVQKEKAELSFLLQTFQNWRDFIFARVRTFILITIGGAAVGLLLSFLIKPTYRGSINFVLENNSKSKLESYAGLASRFGLNMGSTASGLFSDEDNMVHLLVSRTMIAKTLRSPDDASGVLLIKRYLKASGLSKSWEGEKRLNSITYHADPTKSSVLEDSVISLCHRMIIEKNLYVGKPEKELKIIEVTTTSTDELFAKQFSEKLIQNATDFYISIQTKRSQENIDILRHQVDSVRRLLDIALSGAALSTDANPNPNPAFQRLRVPSQKRLVDVEMNKAILEELVKNLGLAEIAHRREMPLIQVIDRPVLPLEKKKLGKLAGIGLGALAAGSLYILLLSIIFYVKQIMLEEKAKGAEEL
jgi:uncharacterized protein involved in exopolysaccharide biosynthesis